MNEKNNLPVKITISVILFIIITCLLVFKGNVDLGSAIIFGYLGMAIPWSWGWTGDKLGRRKIFPSDFFDNTNPMKSTINIFVHICYWVFRIALSVILGGIFFPIALIKLISANKKVKQINPDVTNNSENNLQQ